MDCLDYTCSSINQIYFNITHWQALLFGGETAFLPQNEPWISQKPSHILITLGYYEEHPEEDPNMTEEQLQRINQRKKMRTINAH